RRQSGGDGRDRAPAREAEDGERDEDLEQRESRLSVTPTAWPAPRGPRFDSHRLASAVERPAASHPAALATPSPRANIRAARRPRRLLACVAFSDRRSGPPAHA